jgi:hypothetical protein
MEIESVRPKPPQIPWLAPSQATPISESFESLAPDGLQRDSTPSQTDSDRDQNDSSRMAKPLFSGRFSTEDVHRAAPHATTPKTCRLTGHQVQK